MSRAVGPRWVDQAISNNLSNDLEICTIQFALKTNSLSFMIFKILRLWNYHLTHMRVLIGSESSRTINDVILIVGEETAAQLTR